MLPNNKLFVVWVLDGLGLYEDVIRWEILGWLNDYGDVLNKWWINYVFKANKHNRTITGSSWKNNVTEIFWGDDGVESWIDDTPLMEIIIDLDLAKWLWKNYRGSIDIDFNFYNDNYVKLYKENKLDVAEWLFHNIIDPSERLDLFQMACGGCYGDVSFAKWLLKLDDTIDIRGNNDEVFREACKNSQYDIVEWLCTLCSEYWSYFDEYDDHWKCGIGGHI